MKRMLLISLLLILVLGFSASALDLPKIPFLNVELVVPENIIVGEPFWVDVYLTPFFKETIGGTQIHLETSSSDLYFVGDVFYKGQVLASGLQQGDIFGDNVKLNMDYESKDWVKIESKDQWMSLQGKKKMASVKMMANKAGTYSINLFQTSYSYFDEQNSQPYVLNMPAVTVCVPLSTCPNPFDCGYKDDGCGKVLKCNACDQPKHCVDNACTDLVVVSQNSNDITLCKNVLATNTNEKTLLGKMAAALSQYKDYKIEFNEIVKALTTWFKAAKQ